MTRTELQQLVEDATYNLLQVTGARTREQVFDFVSEYGNLVDNLQGEGYFSDYEASQVVDQLERRLSFLR